jgi:hypothetical protein
MHHPTQWAQRAGPGYGQAPPGFVQSETLQGMRDMAVAINENIRQIFGVRLDRNEEFAWLTFDTTPLTAVAGSTNVRGVMSVGQEADFVATGIVCSADLQDTPPTLVASAFRYQIRDGSTNRELQRSALPQGFLASSVPGFSTAGSQPFFLPKPRIFSRNSNVIWLFDNTQGANINIDVAFFGYRIYDIDALDLTKPR